MGTSVSHYLRMRRMALARTLLARTRLPVGEVASRCGYQNQGAFAERFLAETGLTLPSGAGKTAACRNRSALCRRQSRAFEAC